MKSKQRHILRVLSSIAVGIMAFCLTLVTVLIVGGILLSPFLPKENPAFFPPEFAVLFLITTLGGLIVGIFVGTKYYRYLEKLKWHW